MTDEEMAYEYAKYDDNGRVSVNDDKFKGFLAGLKAGKDMAEADLATVAYMQGAERQKKKSEVKLTNAKNIIRNQQSLLGSVLCNVDITEMSEFAQKTIKQAENFLKKQSNS